MAFDIKTQMIGFVDVLPDAQQIIISNFDGGGVKSLNFDGAIVVDGGMFFDVC